MSSENNVDENNCPMDSYSIDNVRRGSNHCFYQNRVIQPLLTDLYQITMAYAYWKSGKTNDVAVFDLFFRNNPFHGEFTIFAGLEECLKFLKNFHYSTGDIDYLKTVLPEGIEEEFFEYLGKLTAKDITFYAMDEGSVAFPKIPIIKVEGPLIVAQLLETTLLTLVNYASLMATNAARYRIVSGPRIKLLEFGLRRAQGPDGGLSASKYAYIGGFDGTSNVLAGKLFGIPVKGTHAHAYITSFTGFDELSRRELPHKETGAVADLLDLAVEHRQQLSPVLNINADEANDGELAAMISFAIAFPNGFMVLCDTYETKSSPENALALLKARGRTILNGVHRASDLNNNKIPTSSPVGKSLRSGLLNFCSVALAIHDQGYLPVGIRIDSGDLAYLSKHARDIFVKVAQHYSLPWFAELTIVASNDINEETILSLNDQGHKIDCFGIGTHLVTCQKQPALGCVYKLVEINSQPRIKLSQEVAKVTIPGKKNAYRLFGKEGLAVIDIMTRDDEAPPVVGEKFLCRDPFAESKRSLAIPTRVEVLYKVYWQDGAIRQPIPTLEEVRARVQESLSNLRPDHLRHLNPTPYKVAVSDDLYNFLHELWLKNQPIGELS